MCSSRGDHCVRSVLGVYKCTLCLRDMNVLFNLYYKIYIVCLDPMSDPTCLSFCSYQEI